MSIQTLSLAPTNSSDASFRAWGGGISTALAAAGLAQTSDTGQINWTTVARPTTSFQSRGFEIWRFNDSLQATRPVFIRLDYGSSITANAPGVFVSLGTATDGAGLLLSHASFPNTTLWSVGNPAAPFAVPTTGAIWYGGTGNDWSTATANPVYVASDGGSSMMITGWWNAIGTTHQTSSGGFLLVERMRTHEGEPTGDGVILLKTYATVNVTTALVMIGRAPAFYGNTGVTAAPVLHGAKQGSVPASGLVGTTMHVFPVFTGYAPQLCGPSKHVVALYSADQGVNTQFDTNVYGVTGTYRSMGTHSHGWSNEGGSAAVTAAYRVI